MRRGWTNLVLHTTALIYKKKQSLLVSHAFKAVLDIFIIIFLELFLVFISFPLYLMSKEENIGNGTQYKIRRILTLSLLFGILTIWLVKLLLIVGLPLYFDTRQFLVSSEKKEQSQIVEQDFILPNVYGAEIDNSLSPPVVENLKEIGDNHLFIDGKGSEDTKAVLNISNVQTDDTLQNTSIKTYVADIDETGYWSVETNINNFSLLPGEYRLEVMAYDEMANTRSDTSQVKYFEITQNWQDKVIIRLDTYLNYLVIIFLVLGIVSIVLLI